MIGCSATTGGGGGGGEGDRGQGGLRQSVALCFAFGLGYRFAFGFGYVCCPRSDEGGATSILDSLPGSLSVFFKLVFSTVCKAGLLFPRNFFWRAFPFKHFTQ